MSSKDKELSKSRFKMFVKNIKSNTGGGNERSLTAEIERELRPEQPTAQRCKVLKDLGDTQLYNCNLEETSITRLWDLTKDLIVPNKPAEYRQTALTFYKKLIHSQYKNLTLMREHFFLVIQNHDVPEDLGHRLELLEALTEKGKNINGFQEKIAKFMLDWMPAIMQAKLLRPYLEMLENLIKCNAAYLDTDIVVGIVQNACYLSCVVEDNDVGLQSLRILDMVICYTIVPSEPLPQCVITLCRTVNCHAYCQASWRIMKNLLGTQMGYHAMKMMCNILNDRLVYEDQQLLRGAVFHLHMIMFSSNVIFQVSPMFYACTVLTSFLNALDSRKEIVSYEVMLGVNKVITNYVSDLSEIIWDRICDILWVVVDNLEYYERENINKSQLQLLQSHFHENIDIIEKLLQDDKSQIAANLDRIYDLIERVSERRSEASVLNLIEYRCSKITATRPQWLQVLNDFFCRFYKVPNTDVRIKTVQSLVRIMDLNRSSYEEEILERVVIPQFTNIFQEPDVRIRVAVVKALVDFTRHCDTKRCMELLDILEKVINRPFEHQTDTDAISVTGSSKKTENDFSDIITAVDGLIEVFVIKLYRLPSSHAIKIFNILIGHLELHYERPKVFEDINIVRYKIFNWMLKARANASYHIGFPDPTNNDAIKFSYYLGIDSSLPVHGMAQHYSRHQMVSQHTHDIVPSTHITTISIRRGCKMIVKCLEYDLDLQVFQLVIKALPKVLQNKALIHGNDIEALALALLRIYSDNNKPMHLSHKPTTDEWHALVLPAIASLVIYHQFLQLSNQKKIIDTLKTGIFLGTANIICINTMTTVILEMQDALKIKLPEVLLQLSKMSDTAMVAIPVLEFLSTLRRYNHLFINFTPTHYMCVFAIALPYTKPNRYDHYTVSLAYHVIAGWFLKSKLELRKNFVTYIISCVQSNVNMLYVPRTDLLSLNEDSSSRKRSTSLTERGSRNASARSDSEMRPLLNDNLKTFHAELAETCIDFLARHTYSPCSALPKRLPAVEYILKNGVSQTWVVGHNLVTITTSGCPTVPTRRGLCERCAQLGKAPNLLSKLSDMTVGAAANTAGNISLPLSPEVGPNSNSAAQAGNNSAAGSGAGGERRYTKVSLQHSSGNGSAGSTDLTSSSSSMSTTAHSTQRQTSNSSSASLEALSRRGSNPEAAEGAAGAVGVGSSTSLVGNSLSASSVSVSPTQLQPVQQQTCIRSCTGWAEIMIRRPSGNISWITRIQNPIANDCFGQDLPFGDMVSLFLPTEYGGIFGHDFVKTALSDAMSDETTVLTPNILQPNSGENKSVTEVTEVQATLLSSGSQDSLTATATETPSMVEVRFRSLTKARPLQRQEEVSSVTGSATASTAAIDIPKVSAGVLSGSVSDGEADDENLAFDDSGNRARNPVRRVNSSPEMSSSWRQTFLASKPAPLSQEFVQSNDYADLSSMQQLPQQQQQQHQPQQQQKKRSVQYSKDMRVSCEAIPEEIAGSTPPQAQITENRAAADNSSQQKMLEATTLTLPKQHSADDVSNSTTTATGSGATTAGLSTVPVQQSASVDKICVKPPQSPRLDKHVSSGAGGGGGGPKSSGSFSGHQGLAKSSSSGGGASTIAMSSSASGGGNGGSSVADYNNVDIMRGRSKTISVVREVNGKARPTATNFRQYGAPKLAVNTKLCINPSFMFLQLFHTGQISVTDVPLKVTQEHNNSLTLLDLAPPFETHRIGVLYVGPGQCNNALEILRNSHGSTRYIEFLRSIGTLVNLKEASEHNLFVCLDTSGADGKFTYVWKDDIMQVTFHVATLMPTNLKSDPKCNEKKKHIGNDYVHIIYNESGDDYNLNTISGQFSYACVIVEPLELNSNRVYVKARPEIEKFVCHTEHKIVSDRSAPLLARQMALHANLASLVYQSVQKRNPYASNWLERLRIIKRLRAKLIESQTNQKQSGSSSSTSFTSVNVDDDHSTDPLKKQNTNRDFTKYTA